MLSDLITQSMNIDSNLLVAVCLSFATDPLAATIWSSRLYRPIRKVAGNEKETNIRSTLLFGITHSITIAARVFLSFVVLELMLHQVPIVKRSLVQLVLPAGYETTGISLSEAAPIFAGTTWVAFTVCSLKRVALLRSVAGKRLGRVALLDWLLDFVVFLLTCLFILDALDIDISVGIQSLLSAGGIGALVFSLASRDLAEQLVGGLSLNAWEALNKNDKVRLGDGTEGLVVEIGLVETQIRQWDNVVVRIPNSQLTNARIMNLSRVTRSRLLQNVRFQYSDLDKLPKVLEDIKKEIKKSCPKLVPDTEPLAVLTEYQSDYVNARISSHFDIPYACLDFHLNRQEFLLAIHRAMKANEVTVALPSISYYGPDINPPVQQMGK